MNIQGLVIFAVSLLVLCLAPLTQANAQSAAAGGSTATDPSAPPPLQEGKAYVLGAQDVIDVEILGRSDFKVRERIDADGSIKLPLIDKVQAANRTASQLAIEVGAILEKGGFFSHPIVSVEVVSYASRYVTVLGAVVTPGLVPIERPYHLSEILARVGGVRETGADYIILRSPGAEERRFSISAMATGSEAQDPLVAPGDKIYSPPAEVFYIAGQVRVPGSYPVARGMTLRMALARGGGLTDLGTDRNVKVTHKGGKVEKLGLEEVIQPGDVIDVGERLF